MMVMIIDYGDHDDNVNDDDGGGDDKSLRTLSRTRVSLLLKPYLRWLGVWTT